MKLKLSLNGSRCPTTAINQTPLRSAGYGDRYPDGCCRKRMTHQKGDKKHELEFPIAAGQQLYRLDSDIKNKNIF